MNKHPKLPPLLARKLYKTGQTRGADDDEVYQNRVARNSTVLIPYDFWNIASQPPQGEVTFENQFIALISPKTYFQKSGIEEELRTRNVHLGVNAAIFYETRADWLAFDPRERGWKPASTRLPPIGGEYIARIPATTAVDGAAIREGFVTTSNKGAGIRVYEYASKQTTDHCRSQLEALFWMCKDAAQIVMAYGMSSEDAQARKAKNQNKCGDLGLLDIDRIRAARLISDNRYTMCPLCLEEVSAEGFFTRVEQAEGRGVLDLTITQLNLFHVDELRMGQYGHRPYNLGWGHHHCNVVVKDSGLDNTLAWMSDVVEKNVEAGYIMPKGS